MVQAADPLIARRTFDAQTLVTAFPPRVKISDLLQTIEATKFQWGTSDGN